MKNKNILEVCLSPDLGGLELYMSNCSKYLSKEFNVYNAISKNSKLENYFKNEKNIFILKRKNSFSFFFSFQISKSH